MHTFLERIVALFLLVLWAPILVVLALLIKLESPGPGIYKQVRVGKGEKLFIIYKLRTLFINTHKGRVLTENDPRITNLGRFLRKTRIDEVPQLWNIVRGEMVFVGPRPHNVSGHKELLKKFGRRYRNRYSMKPGIFGLVQSIWTRNLGYHRMIACDEFFRLHRSTRLSLWILAHAWIRVRKPKKN